jgi:shikimate dehydrogenase
MGYRNIDILQSSIADVKCSDIQRRQFVCCVRERFMTLRLGLLGVGISRSKMPLLQQYLGGIAGVPVEYDLIDGAGSHIAEPCSEVHRAIEAGYSGLNITHPYKRQVCQMVTRPFVEGHDAIGSYNTLRFEAGEILGANTDFSGFIRGYRHTRSGSDAGSVCLVGAGGVGHAIGAGLPQLGCTQVSVYDLEFTQAELLSAHLRELGVEARAVHRSELAEAIHGAEGLINCTSVGMYNNPGSPIDLTLINGQRWAFDAIYTPLETQFLAECRRQGLQCMSGFDLWLFQGVDAFKIFTGIEVEVTDVLVRTALSWMNT